MTESCIRCKENGEDRRTLYMACFYEMAELNIPFENKDLMINYPACDSINFYTLRVCKSCRADWMSSIKNWFEIINKKESCGSGIFIRNFGSTVEVTREEFEEKYKKNIFNEK